MTIRDNKVQFFQYCKKLNKELGGNRIINK
uniref:Uncharacterized protein n=1 Tax=viral metagenome TaxID=1070528 RepID=A0A6C0AV37_9ZZZZ